MFQEWSRDDRFVATIVSATADTLVVQVPAAAAGMPRTLSISASDKPNTTTPSTALGGPLLSHGTNARSAARTISRGLGAAQWPVIPAT